MTKTIKRVFWDDWGYIKNPFDLYILYDDGSYENYKVTLKNLWWSAEPNRQRKVFTRFRKFAKITTLGILTRGMEVHKWLDLKTKEFDELLENES